MRRHMNNQANEKKVLLFYGTMTQLKKTIWETGIEWKYCRNQGVRSKRHRPSPFFSVVNEQFEE